MANVYSRLLYQNAALPAGLTIGPGPPDGFVWVVRDMVAFSNFSTYVQVTNELFVQESISGVHLWSIVAPFAVGSTHYHWHGHQVLEGELLQFAAGDDGWMIRVSGYQLTLP